MCGLPKRFVCTDERKQQKVHLKFKCHKVFLRSVISYFIITFLFTLTKYTDTLSKNLNKRNNVNVQSSSPVNLTTCADVPASFDNGLQQRHNTRFGVVSVGHAMTD